MSKAAKETLLSTIFSYAGIALGAFYTIFIIPNLFHEHPENYGTLIFLVNYVWIFLIFSSLGTPHCIIKFYPIYNDKSREKLFSFLMGINLWGIIIGSLIFYLYTKGQPIRLNMEGKLVNISYFFYPLLFCMTFFNFFQSYCHALLKIAVPAFLNNTFVRFWLFLILLLYYYGYISFTTFSYLYFGQYIASFIVLILFVWKIKKDAFSFRFAIPEGYKTILQYGLFVLPTTSAAVLITKIDIQMIGNFLDNEQVAYYNNALYFISVLLIPKNALMQTARSVISRDFQTQTLITFKPKYLKISFLFLLLTLIVFVGIFINLKELMLLLGTKFGNDEVKYAIIILGLGRVLESAFVSNHAILEYSKFYKTIPVFEVISLLILIILNIVCIPLYGITGAAISSAIVFTINGLAKSLFVYKKLQLSPIQSHQLNIILSISLLILLYFIPLEHLNLFSEAVWNTIGIICIRSFCFVVFLAVIIESFGLRKLYLIFRKS